MTIGMVIFFTVASLLIVLIMSVLLAGSRADDDMGYD